LRYFKCSNSLTEIARWHCLYASVYTFDEDMLQNFCLPQYYLNETQTFFVIRKCSSLLRIQSNLCTITTLETIKQWPLLAGGHCWEVIYVRKLILGPQNSGRCWQLVARYLLTQVWLTVLYIQDAIFKPRTNYYKIS